MTDAAARIRTAISKALNDGYRTNDIYKDEPGLKRVTTVEMGKVICDRL